VAEGTPPIAAEHLAALRALVAPRHVALVGASGNPEGTAGRPLRYLLEHGYQGVIYPVNPRYSTLGGLRCYPSIEALPETPDVGLVLLGPDRAAAAVGQLARRGTAAAIVLAGGYGEIGPEGEARQRELLQAAGPMRLLGPNSMGVVNTALGAALSPSGALEARPLPRGGIALISQSGGILGSLLSRGGARGIGFSTLVATGNEADLEVADFLELLLEDANTRVIALYLEGLRNPARFARLARRARAIAKPLVAYKVGRSAAGMRSAASHTGAMAGSNRAYDTYFRQLGVVRVDAFGELLDVSSALAAGRPMQGNRLGVLTSTGGAGVLLADAAGARGIEAPPPDAALTEDLRGLLTDEGAVAGRNPVDITLAGLKPEVFASATASLLGSPSYDAVVVVVGASGLASPDLAAKPLIEAGRTAAKPLLGYVSPHAPDILARLNRGNIPTFDSPEGCAAALAALSQVARWAAAEPGNSAAPASTGFTGAGEPSQRSAEGQTHVAAGAPAQLSLSALPGGMLNEVQAAAVFSAFGIPGARSISAVDAAQVTSAAVTLGGEVVLKVLSRHIPHKSDAGGVLVGLTPEQAGTEAAALRARFERDLPGALEGFLVQERLVGTEIILGSTRDAQLGPLLLIGTGGVAAELLGDTVLLLPEVSPADVRAALESLRGYPLLNGFRSRPLADVDALVEAVCCFARCVLALGERLLEAEINPLLVLPAGQGVRAVDALLVLSDEPGLGTVWP